MTHSDLCKIGAKWLRSKCSEKFPVVAIELRSYCAEIPDVFGINGCHTAVIEVKMSRGDFFKDREKLWRKCPSLGVGDFRFYLCPEGLIKPDEVPEKWGLLYADAKGMITEIKPILRGNVNHKNSNRIEKHHQNERYIMYSLLRRKAS